MVTSQCGYAEKRLNFIAYIGLILLVLELNGCASMIAAMVPPQRLKLEDYVACDKHQSKAKEITEEICEQVNDLLHKEAGLPNAVVGFDVQGQGRLQLAGKYKNEEELEKAFAYAQAMVGSDGVSPVKPGHIQVEGWQQCLTEKFAGRQCSEAEDQVFEISKKPPGSVRKRYALVVGIDHFKNIKGKDLSFAVKDATAVSGYLKNPKLGGFPNNQVTVLTDAQATHQGILDALTDIERRAEQDDLVVVYFSSHGTPPDPYGHVNIVTYDTDFGKNTQGEIFSWLDKTSKRETVWNSSIQQQKLHDFFRRVRSKRVLMILDVCYSGDVFTQIPGFKPTASEALESHEKNYGTGISADQLAGILGGAKDLSITDSDGKQLDTIASSPRSPRIKPSAQRSPIRNSGNSAKAWGKVILSASDKDEKSHEPSLRLDSITPNSYFTYYFLENLKKMRGQVQASFLATKPIVNETVHSILHDIDKLATQQPQFFSIPSLDSWNFSINTKQ